MKNSSMIYIFTNKGLIKAKIINTFTTLKSIVHVCRVNSQLHSSHFTSLMNSHRRCTRFFVCSWQWRAVLGFLKMLNIWVLIRLIEHVSGFGSKRMGCGTVYTLVHFRGCCRSLVPTINCMIKFIVCYYLLVSLVNGKSSRLHIRTSIWRGFLFFINHLAALSKLTFLLTSRAKVHKAF
jgi:hypothetical protein